MREHGPRLDHIYVVRTGSVEVVGRGQVVDVLVPGDTFGHISVLSGLAPALSVRAAEETLCYRFTDPRQLVAHPEQLTYAHYGSLVARDRVVDSRAALNRLERPVKELLSQITWCTTQDTVAAVAARMTAANHSCALMWNESQLGVVTDADFRATVATGRLDPDTPIAGIASFPAVTAPDSLSVGAAYLRIIDSGVHHLIMVAPDGTPTGVARVVDLATTDIRDPLLIRSAIDAANSIDQLRAACRLVQPTLVELWEGGMPAEHLGAVHATMIDSIVRKVVGMHAESAPFVGAECAWITLGSVARQEPLPNSDVDTALFWRALDGAGPLNRDVMSAAAEAVLADLESCGLRTCPKGLNASFPLFNRSDEEWEIAANLWRTHPDNADYVLLATTMLDGRALTSPRVAAAFRRCLLGGSGWREFAAAMFAFANSSHPPTGFVRGFVIEHIGDRRGSLNLKRAVLRPVAGLARVLALYAGDLDGSTTRRLGRAGERGLLTVDEADTLIGAFRLCLDLAVDDQIGAIRAGLPVQGHVAAEHLDTLERRQLREAFRAVNRVQEGLSVRRLERAL